MGKSAWCLPQMACLVVLAGGSSASSDDGMNRSLFDFSRPASSKAWVAVNDGVMGGRSQGGPAFQEGVLSFSGTLSLENSGGFSSVRHDVALDLSGYVGLVMKVKGDGRAYQLRLQTDSRYAGWPIAYSAEFATREGEWIEVEVLFKTLRAGFRGRRLSGYTFDPARISSISLMLADKQAGPFRLDVEKIEALSDSAE